MNMQYERVIALAKEIGRLQKQYFRKEGLQIETKSSEVDLVTEVDLMCDKKIVSTLRDLFPEDNILSEEQGRLEGQNNYEWIIDPLDGTTNFSIGHPIFAVSIARWLEGKPVFGVVYIPMLDLCYYAEKGRGAFLNEKPITSSKQTELSKSVLGTGFPYDRASARNNNSDNIKMVTPLIKGLRRMGAAAFDLCLVAEGVYDAFWELRLAKWDFAAGCLIIEESGGYFEIVSQGEKYNCVAGNAVLCENLKKRLDLID